MQNKKIICFLDLDGLIVNCCKSMCYNIGVDYPSNFQFPSDTWLYDKCAEKGMSKNDFWAKNRGFDFWSSMQIYPWSKQLIQVVEKNADDWMFLSKPSMDFDCLSGKAAWVKKHFGEKKLWLAQDHKEYAAAPTRILIDDKKENCKKWSEFGGFAYHWPEITDDFDPTEVEKRLTEIENLITHVRWYNNQN